MRGRNTSPSTTLTGRTTGRMSRRGAERNGQRNDQHNGQRNDQRKDEHREDVGGTPARSARRPASRPSRRAIVGGLLVALAAGLTWITVRSADHRPGRAIVVATRSIAPGERIDPSAVRVRSVDIDADLAAHDFDSTAPLVDAVALAPIAAGEAISRSAVLPDPSGEQLRQFSFPVDRERALNGELRAGERVDVMATFGSGGDATTTVLARDALVLRVVEQRTGTLAASGKLVLTLGLRSADQVLEAVHASQIADLTVVRSTLAGSDTPTRNLTTGPSTRSAGSRP